MISSSASAGPSSTAAGTAVAGTSGSGSAITATSAAAGVGFPPVTTIAAGVAAVGGGIALAGGGGGGDGGGGGSSSTSPMNLTGVWRGSWKDALGAGGDATFTLTHRNDTVSGTVSISGNPCLSLGDIIGRVSGTTAELTIQSTGETIILDAEADPAAKTLNGLWNFSASEVGCAGDRGTFSTSLTTGSADIQW
jgi:hypothetical protein